MYSLISKNQDICNAIGRRTMIAILFLFFAGLGATVRTLIGRSTPHFLHLVIGTIIVNFLGSACLGLLTFSSTTLITVFGVGFIGAFTTFSSFVHDTLEIWQLGHKYSSISYVFISIIGSVCFAWWGILLAEHFH